MKFRNLLIILISCLATCLTAEGRSTLFKNGKTSYSIVIGKDASVSEKTAAVELSLYLNKISGAEFAILEEDEPASSSRRIFIGFNEDYAVRTDAERPADDFEGFTYRNVGKDIWIYGGRTRGTMYGVFAFL